VDHTYARRLAFLGLAVLIALVTLAHPFVTYESQLTALRLWHSRPDASRTELTVGIARSPVAAASDTDLCTWFPWLPGCKPNEPASLPSQAIVGGAHPSIRSGTRLARLDVPPPKVH